MTIEPGALMLADDEEGKLWLLRPSQKGGIYLQDVEDAFESNKDPHMKTGAILQRPLQDLATNPNWACVADHFVGPEVLRPPREAPRPASATG
jgi:hypothetical protein